MAGLPGGKPKSWVLQEEPGLAPLDMAAAGSLAAAGVLARLGSTKEGLAEAEATRLLRGGSMRGGAVILRTR